MRTPTLIASVALGALTLFSSVCQAANEPGPAEPLSTSVEKEPIDSIIPVYRAYVSTGASEKFSFLLPENFRLGGNPAGGQLELVNLRSNCFIGFSLIQPSPDSQARGTPNYREWLIDRFRGKITQEFTQPVLGRSAQAFEMEWKGPGGLTQKARALFVHTSAGLLELTVTSGITNYPTAASSLDQVTGSLIQSVNGKLNVHHLSNRGT